jgi:hypothetical protein
MRAISLTQPWATAIALELKRWETRSWPTSLRGQICIHASKGFPKWAREFAEEMAKAYAIRALFPESLPLGQIVCVADLTECRQTETAKRDLGEREQSWGDYADGRYCFKLENVIRLASPVPATGALGFWRVDWDPAKEVIRSLRRDQNRFVA